MNYTNPPTEPPQGVTHHTFHSQILGHDIGYNIYLPPGYETSDERYPAVYHIHGWKGSESSDIGPLEKVYTGRRAITVFINAISSEEAYLDALFQIEAILLGEVIPHIDAQYRTDPARRGRALSGFSMGGNMAFYYALKHPGLFGAVTAYAGTYHHLYHKDFRTIGTEPEKAKALYGEMLADQWYLEENNILRLVRENADAVRGRLDIALHVGTADILFCDNEIMRMYLESLEIPHVYRTFAGVEHDLGAIV